MNEPALSPQQQKAAGALQRMARLGRLLDASFRVPGTDFRAGIDPLLGLIPGVGDTVSALLSSYLILEAWRVQVPRRKLLKMAGNVVTEMLVGVVPVLGDVFDFAFKANLRNLRIAEEAVHQKHFPVLVEPEKELEWRQPRALLILTLGSALLFFVSGALFARCAL